MYCEPAFCVIIWHKKNKYILVNNMILDYIKSVLVIVPVYNESQNIDFILSDLSAVSGYDVVYVNDASADDSAEKLRAMGQRVVDLPINLGIGGCMQAGYKFAQKHGYDIAVQYDGDGQHCASEIPKLVKLIEDGYDYVIGSRFMDNTGYRSTAARRIGIRLLSLMIRILSGRYILDVTSGFRACNRDVINMFCEYYPRDYPEPEVAGALARKGYSVAEVSVVMRERQGGVSSIRVLKSIYYMIKVATAILFSYRCYPKKKGERKS